MAHRNTFKQRSLLFDLQKLSCETFEYKPLSAKHFNLNPVGFRFVFFQNQFLFPPSNLDTVTLSNKAYSFFNVLQQFLYYFILLIIVLSKWHSDTNRWQTQLIMWSRVTMLYILQRVCKRSQGSAWWLPLYWSCSSPSL